MKILGNPILGKIFAGSSLSLKEDGLYRKIHGNSNNYYIFLTNDVEKICELLDLDFKTIDKISNEAAYDLIIKSTHFTRDCFLLGKKDVHSKAIYHFREYLESKPSDACPGKPIRTEKIEKVLGIEIRNFIDDIKRIFNTPNERLSGAKLLPYLGDYDKRNFEKHFKEFNKQFKTNYEYQKFLKDNTYQEIAKKFREINGIKLGN